MRRWLHTIKKHFEPTAVVLMYHRIADVAVDPWDLAVSAAHFEEQVALLTKKFNVIPVRELVKNLKEKKLAARTVCLTFDDGYTDNYLFAKPTLEKYRCPATFFIASGYTGQKEAFWWDYLEALLLNAPHLPALFEIPIQDDILRFELGTESLLTLELAQKHEAWRSPAPTPTRRCALMLAIWEQLKPMLYTEQKLVLDAIKKWA
ncbi:MAG TPA: polysaccharide deacetylase family protein, partial [Chitinophagaceae bacterium]|nr:polysaccharide deacetylase family protein [Chitinophagaceae bacterium]